MPPGRFSPVWLTNILDPYRPLTHLIRAYAFPERRIDSSVRLTILALRNVEAGKEKIEDLLTVAASMQEEMVLITESKLPKLSSQSKSNTKKAVRFGSVQIYHCTVALGTSPCVSCGPPICLGSLIRASNTTVNAQEMHRSTKRWLAGPIKPLEKRQMMLLTSDERVQMLMSAGIQQKDIVEATYDAMECRMAMVKALQRRRAKKERADSLRRLFSRLGFVEDVKAETDQRKHSIALTKPDVRVAKAC